MLQMFEQKKTKNMKDALGRTGGAIPKRREPESCQPIIFLWSQHHNKFSWELITTFFLAAILRHEFLMFEHNQEKNKDALGCSGCAPGGWPSSCKKITYIRLQNAECQFSNLIDVHLTCTDRLNWRNAKMPLSLCWRASFSPQPQ